MRKIFYTIAFALLLALPLSLSAQITCVPNGNLFVYTNYDGGVLNIDVNVNIPNIKIGICTYEPTTINLTGAYVGNVTEVRYAGYVSTNNHHCTNSPTTTTITGVPGNITSVNFLPPSTLSNPNGYSSIVCAYSCDINTNQGGCNTSDQIKAYFQSTTGGSLTSYFTQYGCWSTQPYQLSAGGNCCNTVLPCNMVANAGPDRQVCPSGQVTLTGSATGGATTYSWSPTTGLSSPNAASTMASPNVTTTYILTASDGGLCADQDTVVVTVLVPQAQLAAFPTMCVNASPITLTGGTPLGGAYSGSGVVSGVFSPASVGAGTTTITYQVVDGNGCTGIASSSIMVQPLPQVSLNPIGPFCQNDPAIVLTNGNPSGGTYAGTGVNNGVFDPGTAGVGNAALTYSFTDSVGCVGNASGTAQVIANPNAPVLAFAAPNLSTTSIGDSIQWFLNGSYLLTNGSDIIPNQNGNYSAVVWVNGCASDTSAATLVELVGVNPRSNALAIQAWPNPVGDELHVAVAGATFTARVSDAMGRQVRAAQTMEEQGVITLRGLSKGIYFIEVQTDAGVANIKAFKE